MIRKIVAAFILVIALLVTFQYKSLKTKSNILINDVISISRDRDCVDITITDTCLMFSNSFISRNREYENNIVLKQICYLELEKYSSLKNMSYIIEDSLLVNKDIKNLIYKTIEAGNGVIIKGWGINRDKLFKALEENEYKPEKLASSSLNITKNFLARSGILLYKSGSRYITVGINVEETKNEFLYASFLIALEKPYSFDE